MAETLGEFRDEFHQKIHIVAAGKDWLLRKERNQLDGRVFCKAGIKPGSSIHVLNAIAGKRMSIATTLLQNLATPCKSEAPRNGD